MLMSHHQNREKSHNIKSENMTNFKCMGMPLQNKNYTHNKTESDKVKDMIRQKL
jgi:hypothetical protein